MKKILIIGAGFLQKFVIRRAKELGYYTLAVDANPSAEGFAFADQFKVVNIVDEKACLEYAIENEIDGVLTAATDYGVLTASYIAQQMDLKGIEYEVAKVIKNKYQVRKKLYEAGADDTGCSYEISSEDEICAVAKEIKFPVMVKPCDGSGSRGASRVDDVDGFKEACLLAMKSSLSKKVLVEPFIYGKEYGVESFVKDGEVNVLAVMGKVMTKPPYYAELGHCVPNDLDNATNQKIRDYVKKAINALGINFGSVNMDLIVGQSGDVHIVDIGARMGGNLIGSHIVPMSTGVDYIGNMIKAHVNDEASFAANGEINPVATRLLALTPGKVSQLPDFENIEQTYGVTIEHHLNINDYINEYHTNLDGVGYVVAQKNNIEDALKCAQEIRTYIDKKIVRESVE